jgi:hypothetical protein
MSFFNTILDLGKKAIGFLSGDSIGGKLAKTALTAYALNKVTKSLNKDNTAARDANITVRPRVVGEQIAITPDQNNRIPVLYGEAFVPAIITDAHLSSDQQVMTYVFTLSETTGVKLSDGLFTSYIFEDVYINDQRVIFRNDGVTIDYTLDREGNQDVSLRDLVTIRVWAGNSLSNNQLSQDGAPTVTPVNAYDVVPTWGPSHVMNQLLFSVMTVRYNADKGSQGVPRLQFHIISDMSEPGDVLYDFVTNDRYGAGIKPEDVFDE